MESKLILAEGTIDALKYDKELRKFNGTTPLGTERTATPSTSRNSNTLEENISYKMTKINNDRNEHSQRVSSRQTKSREKHDHNSNSSKSVHNAFLNSDMQYTVSGMDSKISELKYLFGSRDPLTERKLAAIKLQRQIRGFIARCRYQSYKTSILEWRRKKSRYYMNVLKDKLSAAAILDSKLKLFGVKREVMWTRTVIERWAYVCRQSGPFRRAMTNAAEEKFNAYILKLMIKVCMFHTILLYAYRNSYIL